MLIKRLHIPFLFIIILSLMPGCAYLNGSFQTVEDQQAYRSGQLHPQALERYINELDIQTVISLRKPAPDMQWYKDELALCQSMGVEHLSMGWSMRSLPKPESLKRFVDLVHDAPKPILMHCNGGVHRASIASAVYVLCTTEDKAAARQQIHKHFNDAPIGRLLDLYEESPLPFQDWVTEEYPELYDAIVTPT